MAKPSKFYQKLIPLTLLRQSLPFDKALVRLTGSSLTNHIYAKAGGTAERPCLLMTTIHWKTGMRKTVVLPYHKFGDEYVVQGSLAGRPADPVWATNLRKHPISWIQVDRKWIFCRVHIAQGAERARLWEAISADGAYVGYAKKAYPRILPLVVHAPVDPSEISKPDIDRASD